MAGYTGPDVTRRGRDVAAEAVWTLPQLQDLLDEWVVVVFSNRFKINILDELLFYVANMFVTKRCGWPGGRRSYEAGAVCAV